MQMLSTTKARAQIKKLIDEAHYNGRIFAIGRRNEPEALIIGIPEKYNSKFDEITNMNAQSSSFDFLKDEPDLYSLDDIRR